MCLATLQQELKEAETELGVIQVDIQRFTQGHKLLKAWRQYEKVVMLIAQLKQDIKVVSA